MLVGRMLGTTGVRVRHPDGWHADDVGEHIVGQRAAQVGHHRRFAAQRFSERAYRPLHRRMVGVEPGGVHDFVARAAHLDRVEAVGVEVLLQRWQKRQWVLVDREADLTVRLATRRHSVDRTLRVAGAHGEHLERVPGEHLFGYAQAALAPPGVDLGAIRAGIDHDVDQGTAHRVRNALGQDLACQHVSLGIDDGCDRVAQHDPRIGQQTTPIAGVVTTFAEIDRQVEVERATGSHEDGGHLRCEPGAIRADQQVGAQQIAVQSRELVQAGRADLLAGVDQEDRVETESSAGLQHRAQGRDIDRVLALVVGRSATVIP